jgi:hypothetical protein
MSDKIDLVENENLSGIRKAKLRQYTHHDIVLSLPILAGSIDYME